jgi:hypothetical protein
MVPTLTIDGVGEGKKILTLYTLSMKVSKKDHNSAFSALKVKIISMNNKYMCVLIT